MKSERDLKNLQAAMRKRTRELPQMERPLHITDKSLFHCMNCTLVTADDIRANAHMHETTHSMLLSDSWHGPAKENL